MNITFTQPVETNSTLKNVNGRFVGVNNMFYYGFESKSQSFSTGTVYYFTATVPNGYKFLCWCCYMTEGWIGNGYIHNKNQQTTDFFFSRNPGTGVLRLTYLCVKV